MNEMITPANVDDGKMPAAVLPENAGKVGACPRAE